MTATVLRRSRLASLDQRTLHRARRGIAFPFYGDRPDISFAVRLLPHGANLEQRLAKLEQNSKPKDKTPDDPEDAGD